MVEEEDQKRWRRGAGREGRKEGIRRTEGKEETRRAKGGKQEGRRQKDKRKGGG